MFYAFDCIFQFLAIRPSKVDFRLVILGFLGTVGWVLNSVVRIDVVFGLGWLVRRVFCGFVYKNKVMNIKI